ncbi:DUF488 domain-containing protein [Limobrevibacterium gyesilva]|uniref:DUF488 domain-containing protein n=1 Tax=Limobrevibacterium gyesilva TaxID=2991712 RepID=A0AA41YYB5_9PROT|nr:DUF488 domain-containing protein [Limobrevibacterium gyesilva]MCW3477492.1 DUF488 domain-containing protein [Limobrevibacterium gyesilva]
MATPAPDLPPPTLLTIGYEGCAIGPVLDALRAAGAEHLLDVRAVPQSRKPGFSKRLLAGAVEQAGLRYTHLRGLGTPKAGRDAARHGDVATMERIYAEHMQTLEAQADLENAIAIARTARACLLCFERDHTRCHRSIVANLIRARTGQDVRHLMAEAVQAPSA